MAVYSMTGYATAQTGGAAATNASESPRDARPGLGIEIRSVNSRFLDLTFKLADDLRGTEPALRELLGAALKRGKVEVRAWVEGRTDAGPRAPSAPELQKLVSLQDNIRAWLPTAPPLTVAEVLQLTTRQAGNPGELHETLLELAQTGLDRLLTAPGLPDPGTAPRSQHHGLQIVEPGTHPHFRGHEGAHRTDARTGPEH